MPSKQGLIASQNDAMKVGQFQGVHIFRSTRIYGPLVVILFSFLSSHLSSIVHPTDVALILMGWCTWISLIEPIAGVVTTMSAGVGFLVFHAEPRNSFAVQSHDDIVTIGLIVGIGVMVSVITMYRVRQAVVRLNEVATLDAMDDFLKSATHDQPTIDFAQRAFQAVSAELAFIDVRLEKNMSADLPTYDLAVWNHHKSGNHPRLIDVTPKGIAIRFENPRIWYELVFTSRRGFGTLPVRRFLLQAVANRMEEFLLIRLRLESKNGKHKEH